MKIHRILPTALCGIIASATLHATEIQVTAASERPPETTLISCEASPHGNFRWFRISASEKTGRRDVGQTFVTTHAAALTRLALRIAPIDDAVGEAALSAEFTVQIFEIKSPQEWSSATLISEQKGHLPSQFTPGEYLFFDLEALSLKADTHYAFLFIFDAPAQNRHINFSTAAIHSYPDGIALSTTFPASEGEREITPVRGNLAFSVIVKE